MTRESDSKRYRQLLFVVTLVGLLTIAEPQSITAQVGDGSWSIPVKIYEGKGSIREPTLVADQTGALHALWTYTEEEASAAIFYARWRNGVWTPPVDIIAMDNVLQGPSSVVDSFGRIHLIWQGPGNTLFYSSSSVAAATSAASWTSPLGLAQSNPHAHLVIDDNGTLHLVYPGLVESGVFYMTSTDRGNTWSAPILVTSPVRVGATTNFTRLAVASSGGLHIVWTELTLPSGWPPLGVFYARSTDGGLTWSQPFALAPDGHLEANIVIANESTVHTVWNAMASISGRYHRWSNDEGATWSKVIEVAPRSLSGGSTGPPGLTVDSAGRVHVVVNTGDTVPRTGTGDFGATLYSFWDGSAWSSLQNVSSAAPDYVSLNNEESAIAAVQGNQLHVLFFGDETHTLWHTYKMTIAPLIAPVPFALSSSNSAVVEKTTPAPSPTIIEPIASASATAVIDATAVSPLTSNSTNPVTAVIVGILPAAILVGGVMLFALNRRRTR